MRVSDVQPPLRHRINMSIVATIAILMMTEECGDIRTSEFLKTKAFKANTIYTLWLEGTSKVQKVGFSGKLDISYSTVEMDAQTDVYNLLASYKLDAEAVAECGLNSSATNNAAHAFTTKTIVANLPKYGDVLAPEGVLPPEFDDNVVILPPRQDGDIAHKETVMPDDDTSSSNHDINKHFIATAAPSTMTATVPEGANFQSSPMKFNTGGTTASKRYTILTALTDVKAALLYDDNGYANVYDCILIAPSAPSTTTADAMKASSSAFGIGGTPTTPE